MKFMYTFATCRCDFNNSSLENQLPPTTPFITNLIHSPKEDPFFHSSHYNNLSFISVQPPYFRY